MKNLESLTIHQFRGLQNLELQDTGQINDRFIPKGGQKNLALPVATITPFSHRAERFQMRLLSDAIFQDFKSEVIKLLQYMDSGIIDLELLVPPGQRIILPIPCSLKTTIMMS
ncbi:hypothetical protein [Anabaena sp. CS-542/02]|uniref:hypothetical protein n=1 Tax=Anabaena sp. CS-542/02 TaxID=3021719 RepID=UPI00232DEC2F|nr:hypothetical protein [Anabaena sp. CS-542/02]MDB9445559.1 hypothetical protein [Anabaena sp. CS-542/02]